MFSFFKKNNPRDDVKDHFTRYVQQVMKKATISNDKFLHTMKSRASESTEDGEVFHLKGRVSMDDLGDFIRVLQEALNDHFDVMQAIDLNVSLLAQFEEEVVHNAFTNFHSYLNMARSLVRQMKEKGMVPDEDDFDEVMGVFCTKISDQTKDLLKIIESAKEYREKYICSSPDHGCSNCERE